MMTDHETRFGPQDGPHHDHTETGAGQDPGHRSGHPATGRGQNPGGHAGHTWMMMACCVPMLVIANAVASGTARRSSRPGLHLKDPNWPRTTLRSEPEITAETLSQTVSATGDAAAELPHTAASLGLPGGPSAVPATLSAAELDPVQFPDVLGRSARELIAELATLQDQITQIAARAGYSSPSPINPFEPAPDPQADRSQDDHPDHPGANRVESALGVIEALDLLEALEQRERTVLTELHRPAYYP